MRKINEIIVHCAATPEGKNFTVEDIDAWHKQRGWSGIGYHWVVYLDGSVHAGRPERKVGAHVAGHNTGTLGVCYIGGVTADNPKKAKDTRTPAQKRALEDHLTKLVKKYNIKKISGHNQYAAKACPCFNAKTEYAHLVSSAVSRPPAKTPAHETPAHFLRQGSRGWEVKALQQRLKDLGHNIVVDGMFGPATRNAVAAVQLDAEIPADGIVGPQTRAALRDTEKVTVDVGSRKTATKDDLKGKSRIMKKAGMMQSLATTVGVGAGAVGAAEETGVLDNAQTLVDQGNRVQGLFGSATEFISWAMQYWWILIPVIAFVVWWNSRGISDARLEDHRDGKTI